MMRASLEKIAQLWGVVAMNNAGAENLMFDPNTGRPTRAAGGGTGFGIRADEIWKLH